MSQIRIYLQLDKLRADQVINLDKNDFNYLIKVMRKKLGDEVNIFNNNDGEWNAKITDIGKKNCTIRVIEQVKQHYIPPKITIAFAPVKNVRIDFIAAKATELGIANFQPIITKNTIVDKVNIDRFNANIKEAAEQCERVDLPTLQNITKLTSFIKTLKANQILILCDESGSAKKAGEVLSKISFDEKEQEIIIFTGPEGGFSTEEFSYLRALPNLYSISLGPRILRADTAILSAITLVQEFLGDFNNN
ncbi:MAG: 16S rRNA (uracil(1498)-N(3))-methyltransferase [Proteobacteria bacterium]|nr:16S rRNA (uracil(1498)-N(3))-methyltransferase [Pseudomonadota bacterium]